MADEKEKKQLGPTKEAAAELKAKTTEVITLKTLELQKQIAESEAQKAEAEALTKLALNPEIAKAISKSAAQQAQTTEGNAADATDADAASTADDADDAPVSTNTPAPVVPPVTNTTGEKGPQSPVTIASSILSEISLYKATNIKTPEQTADPEFTKKETILNNLIATVSAPSYQKHQPTEEALLRAFNEYKSYAEKTGKDANASPVNGKLSIIDKLLGNPPGTTDGWISSIKELVNNFFPNFASMLSSIPFIGKFFKDDDKEKNAEEKEEEMEYMAEVDDTDPHIENKDLPPPGIFTGMPDAIKQSFETTLNHENGKDLATKLKFATKEGPDGVSYNGVKKATLEEASKVFYESTPPLEGLGLDRSDPLMITSCCDGQHGGDTHPKGQALDIRTKENTQNGKAGKIAWNKIETKFDNNNGWEKGDWKGNSTYSKETNGLQYQIILENKGKDQEHIHFSIRSLGETANKKSEKIQTIQNTPITKGYEAYKPLRDMIMEGEADEQLYNSYNTGIAGKSGVQIDFSQKTLDQVITMQNNRDIFAVGAYQFSPYKGVSILTEAKQVLGLNGTEMFTPALQDEIFVKFLLHRDTAIHTALTSGSNQEEAVKRLAQRWAAIQTKNGKGYYDGKAGNKGTIPYEKAKTALEQTRALLNPPESSTASTTAAPQP